ERGEERRRRAGGPLRLLAREVVRWHARGVCHRAGRDEDVPVLDTRVELDTAAAQLLVERLDHLARLLARGMAAGEVDHRAVVADRDEVAAVRDLIWR